MHPDFLLSSMRWQAETQRTSSTRSPLRSILSVEQRQLWKRFLSSFSLEFLWSITSILPALSRRLIDDHLVVHIEVTIHFDIDNFHGKHTCRWAKRLFTTGSELTLPVIRTIELFLLRKDYSSTREDHRQNACDASCTQNGKKRCVKLDNPDESSKITSTDKNDDITHSITKKISARIRETYCPDEYSKTPQILTMAGTRVPWF